MPQAHTISPSPQSFRRIMSLKKQIVDLLYQPDWFQYRDYRKDDKGWPVDWAEAEKRLKGETADKIIKLLE